MKTVSGNELKNLIRSKVPLAVFYFMETCPHCIPMHAPWDELSREKPNVKFVKIESADVPSEMGISGFPHFEYVNGSKKSVDGEMSKEELKAKLFGKLGGLRRLKTRRLRALRKTRRVR